MPINAHTCTTHIISDTLEYLFLSGPFWRHNKWLDRKLFVHGQESHGFEPWPEPRFPESPSTCFSKTLRKKVFMELIKYIHIIYVHSWSYSPYITLDYTVFASNARCNPIKERKLLKLLKNSKVWNEKVKKSQWFTWIYPLFERKSQSKIGLLETLYIT